MELLLDLFMLGLERFCDFGIIFGLVLWHFFLRPEVIIPALAIGATTAIIFYFHSGAANLLGAAYDFENSANNLITHRLKPHKKREIIEALIRTKEAAERTLAKIS